MSKNKLFIASKRFVNQRNEHCLILTLNQDGSNIEASGDEGWISAALENPEVFEALKASLVNTANNAERAGTLQHSMFPKTYTKLFACPGTKKWKGVQIRAQLSKYLAFHGYGHNMPMRYGEDEPPIGWPVLVDWVRFKGPSKSCSFALCTEIILQLMEAQGLNPLDHYNKPENYESSEDEEDASEDDATDEEGQGNLIKRTETISTNVVKIIAHLQEIEERQGEAYNRRKSNIAELKEGLKALEEGELVDDNE